MQKPLDWTPSPEMAERDQKEFDDMSGHDRSITENALDMAGADHFELNDMMGDLTPRRCSIYLATGDGLPNRICIGSVDCPAETHLEILNRDRNGTLYSRMTRIIVGAFRLDDRPLQGGDQTYSPDGRSFKIAHDAREESRNARPFAFRMISNGDVDPGKINSFPFIIHGEDGKVWMLALSQALEARQIADFASEIAGPCQVSIVNAGSMVAASNGEIVAPGYVAIGCGEAPMGIQVNYRDLPEELDHMRRNAVPENANAENSVPQGPE